jgi:hypothetical protein
MREVRVGVRVMLLLASVVSATSLARAQTPMTDQNKDGGAAAQAPARPTPPPAPLAKPKIERWFELQTASIQLRYRRLETSGGVVSNNHAQDSIALKARVKFDSKGKYSVNAGAATGTSFTGGWNNTGIGTGGPITNMYLKQLFLAASPAKGLDLSYGGLAFVRGDSTEITSYDNDGYLTGARISVKRPKDLYFDEISFTNAYLGDLTSPSFLDRTSRLNEANYRHLLIGKRFGKTVSASADYTRLSGVDTFRTAINAKTPHAHVIDFVRYEQYRRLGPTADFGYAVYAEKAVVKRFSLGLGYADIDAHYGGLNADRFNKGRRIFEQANLKVTRDLSVSAFLTQAVHNSFAVSNKKRVDIVAAYNVLGPIQRAGYFR